MKLKVFILLMIIVFCTSCDVQTKNDPYAKHKTTEVEEVEEIETKYTLYILNNGVTVTYKTVTLSDYGFKTIEGKEIIFGDGIKYFYVEE